MYIKCQINDFIKWNKEPFTILLNEIQAQLKTLLFLFFFVRLWQIYLYIHMICKFNSTKYQYLLWLSPLRMHLDEEKKWKTACGMNHIFKFQSQTICYFELAKKTKIKTNKIHSKRRTNNENTQFMAWKRWTMAKCEQNQRQQRIMEHKAITKHQAVGPLH